VVGDPGAGIVPVDLAELEPPTGSPLGEPCRDRREDVAADAGRESDDEHRSRLGGGVGHVVLRGIPCRQQRLRPSEERLARCRERHAAAVPHQEPDLELALERSDLLRERRLRDEQPLGRPREVQFFGDGDEVPQLSQAHVHNRR